MQELHAYAVRRVGRLVAGSVAAIFVVAFVLSSMGIALLKVVSTLMAGLAGLLLFRAWRLSSDTGGLDDGLDALFNHVKSNGRREREAIARILRDVYMRYANRILLVAATLWALSIPFAVR